MYRGGVTRSSDEVSVMEMERRGYIIQEYRKINICKSGKQKENYPQIEFDFLGYRFRPRKAKNKKGKIFIGFIPAVSKTAIKKMYEVMRELKIHRRSDKSLKDLAEMVNPIIQGWINYYGQFYKSALYPILRHIDEILKKWANRKYKKLRNSKLKQISWLERVKKLEPNLFAHWKFLPVIG